MEISACTAADEASDYGSDFTPDEEDLLNNLLQVQPPLETDNPIVKSELQYRDVEESLEGLLCLRLPATATDNRLPPQLFNPVRVRRNNGSDTVRTERERSVSIEAPLSPGTRHVDLRSPIERFRSKPRKPLSVTDLISPSWCELQYWYALTKHGKKKRTPAMRQGSKVHQTLEDQVHVTVPVESKVKELIGKDVRGIKVPKALEEKLPKRLEDELLVTVPVEIKTKEDSWGLRLWNIIQGLRTLRETGMTREIEVWGLLDGQIVNGVIDELSYVCPDRPLEAAAEETSKSSGKKSTAIAPDQATITEFFNAPSTIESTGGSLAETLHYLKEDAVEPSRRIYISDVKTRGARSLPKGASFKPTMIQLLLYHRLLGELAEGKFDADVLFERYDLKKALPFTDSFVAQIGGLNLKDLPNELENTSATVDEFKAASQESVNTLLAHNSLGALWTFMMEEFHITFPKGAQSLGRVLQAEYRDALSGNLVGSKTILYDHDTLQTYLDHEMQWWRGARSAKGVPIEEAFKCGSCEFAEGCEWRINKIDDHVKSMRSRSRV